MARPVAEPGQLVDLEGPETISKIEQKTCIKTAQMEIVRLLVPAGATVPTHEAQGEIILHCLEGRVTLTAGREARELHAGHLLYLLIQEPFSIRAIESASLLVTILRAHRGPNVELIGQ